MAATRDRTAGIRPPLNLPVLTHGRHLELFALTRPPHAPAVVAAARDALVLHNLRLAARGAADQRRKTPYVDPDDLLGYATAALIEAVDRFDPALGFRFSTFAANHISYRLRRWTAELEHLVRVPAYLAWVKPGHPDYEAVSRARHCIGVGGGDAVPDLAAPEPEPGEPDYGPQTVARLRAALGSLPARERDVLTRWAGGETLDAVGRDLGLSRERVRQLKNGALERLGLTEAAVARGRAGAGRPWAPTRGQERMARALVNAGYSQREVAGRLGMSQTSISRLIKGRAKACPR